MVRGLGVKRGKSSTRSDGPCVVCLAHYLFCAGLQTLQKKEKREKERAGGKEEREREREREGGRKERKRE